MTLPLKIAAGSAMAFAAACALPLGAETGAAPVAEAPVSCTLAITETAGMVTVSGRLEARGTVSGTYDLTLRQSSFGGMADVRQGGAFSLAPGESAELGQASFSGKASDLDGTLTIAVGDKTFLCPITN